MRRVLDAGTDSASDSSLTHYDNKPYFLPTSGLPVIDVPRFAPETKAAEWMHGTQGAESIGQASTGLVEVPCNWYGEDMTPLQFYPHTANSQGYVDARVVEGMWRDRFEWLRREMEDEDEDQGPIFPLVLHPDTSGMAHVIGMVERVLTWLRELERGEQVEFLTMGAMATRFRGHGR